MTAKERVRTAITHRQPDRTALDFSARGEVIEKLRQRLGLSGHASVEDRLGMDLRGVGPDFARPCESLAYADPTLAIVNGDVHCDIWGVGFRPNQTSCGFYMDLALNPLQKAETVADIERHSWPSPDWWDYSHIEETAKAHADYWILGHSRGIFEISWFLRGFGEFLSDLACEPARAEAVMDHVQAYLMERARRVLEAANGHMDMMEYNDDVGGQDGLLMAPDMWRRFLKPRMAAFIAMCKTHGVKVKYHSCGSVRAIIPDLIDIGVDVLNPIQARAAGMDAEELKREFGAHLTFNGGIDTQDLLPFAPVKTVREATRRLIDIVGKDGGLILAPSHVFQDDVPLENIIAVYETALGAPLM
ncbi:MAG TPA: uroporphyrinogen decarboxylase family protein [Candidatus Hydrogenedentes bacterium]|nr:uroporphyrinogen decarboxylase family protein [Candidatus Hydrogenedentota bacterium]HRT19472.1 uroporphyrinogen decarboxylase family protein [Candidatus Hydrogenedentota bacterium]HRT63794.1 uroporphyrinogen decarboxylase family protein [Candidatus Hydrogenedentota bacterium]